MLYFLRVQQQLVLELSYQQVITNFQVQKPIQMLCNNKIYVNNIKVLYCQKQALLSSNQVSQQFISQKYHSYFSLYTEKMKDAIVNFQVLPFLDLPSFYLFGATENILIQNSKINVKISQLLAESALICFKCDLHAIQSSLVFVGVGTNISGLVLIGKSYITLESCSVQSRLSGQMIGGLVIQSNKITVNLKDSNITSYFNGNGSVGALISFATDTIQIQSSNVKMCTNAAKNVGSGESFVTISGSVTQNCQICGNMKYSYGICINSLDNSEETNYKLVCKPIFVFDGEACSCQDGKVLNGSSCINILDATSHLLNQFESFDLSLRLIDAKLFDKIFALKQSTTDQINQVSSSTPNFNTRIDTQSGVTANVYQRYLALNEAIQQFVLKIKCGRQYGHAYVNNQCQYVECPISGQQVINGVCQCSIQNMLVIGNVCTCPVNSSLINNACTCTVSGQVVKNGACQCEVVDAFVSGSTCVCPASSTVVGNACVCSVTGKVIIGGVCICPTSGAFVFNGACSCGTDGLNISNVCSCPTYSSLVGNACICGGVIGISMISGSCQCPPDNTIVSGMCQYTIQNGDTGITCSQSTYTTTFDIQAITHSVISNANYSSGYVFKTSPIITNAFIDISSNVYTTTVQPLFQSQASFTNIKVQIGTQTVSSGSILTTATTIIITQLNIISKLNTQIMVNSLQQLQIVQNQATSANINNLLVNLSFALSSGNITLISALSGVINITGYQVLGVYQSTKCIAMITFTVASSSKLKISNVTFKPNSYNIGNASSYFLIQVVGSNIVYNNISVILGSISQFQTLVTISSTDSQKFQFGGLISIYDDFAATTLIITNLLYNNFQSLKTDYVFQLGFILGAQSTYASNNANISSLCILQNLSSTSLKWITVGLIAGLSGQLNMNQSSIILTTQSYYDQMNSFGVFGVLGELSGYSELFNLLISMNVQVNAAKIGYFGFIGINQGTLTTFKNSLFKNYNFTTQSQAGILCSDWNVQTSSVINTTVESCNIVAGGSVGGFFAHGWSVWSNTVLNSTIKNINITSIGNNLQYIGPMIGQIVSTYYLQANYQNTSIINNNIQGISVTAGVIGQIDNDATNQLLNVSIVDFIIQNNNISGNMFTSGIVASFCAVQQDKIILLIQNLTFYGCNIQCAGASCGGLIGSFGQNETQSATLTVKNLTMQNIKISGPSYVAGFVAISQKCIQFTTLQIYNSTVTAIVLSGQNCGMVTGFRNGTTTFDIKTSKTTGNNFVNSTLIQNCASITSGISQSGC
ncbi:Conserved_hypothetical protein [Hexamita inflata]|uniref:Uncharacterized protein n=1 Tax=Hexamita inflata TaxID=28002 RepID=A0AA86QKU7_9EUKA|nr:Conserved hypothetical protein [Hexamita inflata]